MKVVKVLILICNLAFAVEYKFLKVENFSSTNENVVACERFEMSPTRINVTFDIKQPIDKIQVIIS
jgi:hypothetical protein